MGRQRQGTKISKAGSQQYASFFKMYFVSQFHSQNWSSTTSSHLMIQILSFILRKMHIQRAANAEGNRLFALLQQAILSP